MKKLLLFCVILSLTFCINVCAEEKSDYSTKVYNLEKSLGSYYDVLEFEDAAKEASPTKEPTEATFLDDLKNSFSARETTVNRFRNFKNMYPKDIWALREVAVLAEEPFYKKYSEAPIEFEDNRLKSLSSDYMSGLQVQMNAIQEYGNLNSLPEEKRNKKEEELIENYISGCITRERVINELNALYSFGLDTSNFIIKEDFDKMIEEAKSENYPSDLVLSAKRKLNELGYNSGTEDGLIGTNTVIAIYDYQRANNLEMNGKLTNEVIESLGI